jgi:hemolysin III
MMAQDPVDRHDATLGDEVREGVADLAAAVKPLLRGWIHLGMAPLALVAGVVLVAASPTDAARLSTAVFAVTSVLLFGTSAVYHRGTWSSRVAGVLRRLDHSNIFLIIAGTYTPLAVLLLPSSTARLLLWVVWVGAVLGLTGRVLWLHAPRWVYTPIYVALGSVALGFLPQFDRSGGTDIVALVVGGGVAYIAGAVVYALQRPNPSPRWFGFHEVFHVLTVIGFGCHYAAVWLAAMRSA